MSPAGWEYLHRAIQPAHPASQFFSIDAGELEGWILRFLTSIADKPSWEHTVSLVNEHNQTLAHLAVLSRYTSLLKKVAEWGIDVDVQDVNGFTALHCAYLCGDLDSVGILKGYGADEDIQDNLERRPLDMYTPSTSDTSRGSPLSDRISSSAQRPTAGEEDCETVSMASSQPSSFSSHEAAMELPASGHQPLRMRESITVPSEYTIHERWEIDCARFEDLRGEDWYINQEVEPYTRDGKSVLSQWLDEVEKDGTRHVECCVPLVDQADDWCRKAFPRFDRAVVHVRNHLGHKPYLCGGYPDCEQEGWYVKKLVTCC